MLVERSFKNALRVLRSETAGRVLDLENGGAPVEDLLPYIGGDAYARVVGRGDLAAGVMSCGQGVGLIKEILPAGKVIQRMVEEARVALGRLNTLFP